MTPTVQAAALALVLTATPAEPRQLTPFERQLYRLTVEWQSEAERERALRKAAERKLADLEAELPDPCVCPECEECSACGGWSTLEVVGVSAIVAVVAGGVALVVGVAAGARGP